ncbi:MAG TPA: succinylglutamate desuccinylase/aspartoacylase family protein [Thiobacillus sp.]|jgi:predicted deacylase|nr:MAG: succinylglutamate desuccinylase [Hydrogenophilales bacterium 16-64-40]OZA35509.1 MAG: succinylglutamate desuccinylase [Hydrogenophilales bacterium 17-64-65]HQS81773.1 succinylglutamate desuccinylase/aspartoacylase family protein [Thiobacillus sp.]HQT35219.1 succinylglutamate desuccinylase/aspartoacylase family protein [Thiobacillus sp.]
MSELDSLHFQSVSFTGHAPGARLIVLGAVHGNEICGTQAIRRVIGEIESGQLGVAAGSLTFVPVANPLAYARKQRMGDRNLNRNLVPTDVPAEYEDRIANWLCPLLAQHDVLLDLHSFHTAGQPFVMLGPQDNRGALEPFARAAEETALALRLGVRRFVDGWLDTYAAGVARRLAAGASSREADVYYGVGTTEYMRAQGGIALTLECGQHDDPAAPAVAYRAIRNTLAHLRLCDVPAPVPVADTEALRLYQVVDRVHAADAFARGWSSFDRVHAGEVIGTRHDGALVVADSDGYIVFPNPNALPGQEWYYLAKRSTRV